MKAAVVSRYGSPGVIELRDVPTPSPGPGELLVHVHAATVNRTDCGELRHPTLIGLMAGRGWSRRKILGMDFAGTVEALGEGVTLFGPGDRIFGMCPLRNEGAQAEYLRVSEAGPIAAMPANLPFNRAVLCEGAYYAAPAIDYFDLKPGKRILVYGASGAIGSAGLQLAKLSGADVTAVVAGRHLDLARALGADAVVDYASEAFDRLGRDYDIVWDTVGKLRRRHWRRLLKPKGIFATTDLGPGGQHIWPLLWSWITRSGRAVVPLPKRASGRAFVNDLRAKIEAGQFVPVIDRTWPLAEIAEAYRYVQTGQKAGVVVIDVAEP